MLLGQKSNQANAVLRSGGLKEAARFLWEVWESRFAEARGFDLFVGCW
jgi:hypothetical protein